MCPSVPYDWWCGMFLALHTLSGVLRLSGAAPSPGVSQGHTDTEPVCAVCEASLDRATPLPDTRRRERDHSPRNKAQPFLYRSVINITSLSFSLWPCLPQNVQATKMTQSTVSQSANNLYVMVES